MRTQFGTMPVPRSGPTTLAIQASRSCDWLMVRQNPDGSWGSGTALDRLISTCHVMMTLTCAGIPIDSRPLTKALAWLTSKSPQEHNNSYWILGPLGSVPGVSPELSEREVRRLEQVLRTGAKPNPDQLVEAFYLRALRATGVSGDRTVRRQALKFILDTYHPDTGWNSRADSTTDGYAALNAFAPSKAADVRPSVEAFLRRHAERKGDQLSWGNPIQTSYTIMNVVDSDLIDSEDVRTMVSAAVRGLLSSCQDELYWDGEPPYGGKGDLKSVDFPTAVVTRALLAVNSILDPAFQADIAGHRLFMAQERLRRRGVAATSLLGILAGAALTPFDEALVAWAASFASWDVERSLSVAGTILGILMGGLALAIALAPESTRLVTSRVRRKMRF